jgi:hypothetical protein
MRRSTPKLQSGCSSVCDMFVVLGDTLAAGVCALIDFLMYPCFNPLVVLSSHCTQHFIAIPSFVFLLLFIIPCISFARSALPPAIADHCTVPSRIHTVRQQQDNSWTTAGMNWPSVEAARLLPFRATWR